MIWKLFLKKVFVFTFIIFSLLGSTEGYCCNKVVLKQSTSVPSQMRKENVTYVVKHHHDLKGAEISIPNNCQLKFQGGSFSNGVIKGNSTEVGAGQFRIFTNVILDGSWANKTVYSEWLDFVEGEEVDNAINFKNLMLLCTGERLTHLYMQEGVYFCSVIKESNIKIPSNIYWHNSATIKQLPTDLQRYALVLIKQVSNVIIDGGEFVGDVQTHTGEKGEWGHGIKVAGATNVVLKNLVSREFWGDGIDLIEANYVSSIDAGVGPCDGVTIDNVKCLYNRRQGMSIEAAKNVVVKNSEFAYTGKYKMTAPGCGVDIEPWCKNEEKIYNLKFENCYIHDNNPIRDFSVEPNCQHNGNKKGPQYAPVNKVVINKCRTGHLFIHGANDVVFNQCDIDDISRYDNGYSIKMNDCTIKKQSGLKSRTGLTKKQCK